MTDVETFTRSTGEFVEVRPADGGGWQAVVWPSESDYLADVREGGDWFDRSTFSVVGDTRADVIADVRP